MWSSLFVQNPHEIILDKEIYVNLNKKYYLIFMLIAGYRQFARLFSHNILLPNQPSHF